MNSDVKYTGAAPVMHLNTIKQQVESKVVAQLFQQGSNVFQQEGSNVIKFSSPAHKSTGKNSVLLGVCPD